MDTQLLIQILLASVPAGVVGLVVFAIAASRNAPSEGREDQPARPTPWIPILLASACVVGLSRLIVGTWPTWPPVRSEQWMPWCAALAGAAGLALAGASRWWERSRLRTVGSIAALSLVCGVLTTGLSMRRLLAAESDAPWASAIIASILAGVLTAGLTLLAARRGRAAFGSTAIIVSLFAGTLVAAFASLTLGRYVGVLAAFLCGGAIVAMFRPSLRVGAGLGMMAGVFISAAGVQAYAFGTSPAPWTIALAALAPWAALAVPRRKEHDATGDPLRLCAAQWVAASVWIAAVLALGLVLAKQTSGHHDAGTTIEDYQ